MELDKNIFEEINKTFYFSVSRTYNKIVDVFTNRPSLIAAGEQGKDIYKVNKYYILHIPENFKHCTGNVYYKDYIADLVGEDEDDLAVRVVKEHNYSEDNKCFYDDVTTRTVQPDHISKTIVLFFTDCEKITEFTPKEKAKLEEIKRRASENNIVQKLLLDTTKIICEEFGIVYDNGIFKFKSRKDCNKFIYIALNETVFKKLRENGFRIYKTGFNRNLSDNCPLFTINDLGISEEEKNKCGL